MTKTTATLSAELFKLQLIEELELLEVPVELHDDSGETDLAFEFADHSGWLGVVNQETHVCYLELEGPDGMLPSLHVPISRGPKSAAEFICGWLKLNGIS